MHGHCQHQPYEDTKSPISGLLQSFQGRCSDSFGHPVTTKPGDSFKAIAVVEEEDIHCHLSSQLRVIGWGNKVEPGYKPKLYLNLMCMDIRHATELSPRGDLPAVRAAYW